MSGDMDKGFIQMLFLIFKMSRGMQKSSTNIDQE